MEFHITSLNVVCFVSIAGETHRLDTEVFQKVREFLGDKYSEISMMVLTHCDEFDDDDLNEFEQAIRKHNLSKPCFEYCQLGIVRYGKIDFNKIKAYKESARTVLLQDKLERIEGMRNNFLKKIISCADKGLKIAELQQIYDESRKAQQMAIELNEVRQQEEEAKLLRKVLEDIEGTLKKPKKQEECVLQ